MNTSVSLVDTPFKKSNYMLISLKIELKLPKIFSSIKKKGTLVKIVRISLSELWKLTKGLQKFRKHLSKKNG